MLIVQFSLVGGSPSLAVLVCRMKVFRNQLEPNFGFEIPWFTKSFRNLETGILEFHIGKSGEI